VVDLIPAVPDPSLRNPRSTHWRLSKLRSASQIYAETGLAQEGVELDRLVRKNAAYTIGYYRRLACILESSYRARLLSTIQPTGLGHLIDAHRLGRGLILVAPHLGDFDLAVAWIAEAVNDFPVVPVANLERPWAQRAYALARRACNFDLLDSDATTLPALAAKLDKGRTVILTLDRRSGARELEVEIFGRSARLPAGCISLARLSGAPLLSAATWNRSRGRSLNFGEPIEYITGPSVGSDVVLLQRLATEMELAIRAAPQQWHIPACLDELSVATTRDGRPQISRG
jgi:phosphatidylinositol dimannoside acyltransferase